MEASLWILGILAASAVVIAALSLAGVFWLLYRRERRRAGDERRARLACEGELHFVKSVAAAQSMRVEQVEQQVTELRSTVDVLVRVGGRAGWKGSA